MARRDERSRDGSEVGRKAALRFEALAKAGAEEKIPEARHDAAGDEYATPCTDRQCDVALETAKHRAERLERCIAVRVLAAQSALGYRLCRERFRLAAAQAHDGAIKIRHAN